MLSSFYKFAGGLGLLAGASGLLYFVFFILLRNSTPVLSALFLMLIGIFASAALVALYQHLRLVDEGFALWGLLLGIGGAGGAAIHGAFDLANTLNPPTVNLEVPFPPDPRGFLTFAVSGLAICIVSWLMLRGGLFTRLVAYLGLLTGILLIALYIAYMLLVNATNPLVLVLILVTGILNPLWYLWIGWLLWQGKSGAAARAPAPMS